MTYKILTPGRFPHGYIITEIDPHGFRTVWAAFDDDDLLRLVRETVNIDRSDAASEADTSTMEGCLEYLRHDLKSLNITRYSDITAQWLLDARWEEIEEAEYLEWIVKIEIDDH
jgi:hypothetical protein